MISLEGLIALLSLPVKIILIIIQYYLGKTKFTKYEKRLKLCVKLTIYKVAMSMPIKDTKYIPVPAIDTLLNVVKMRYSSVIKDFDSYGERYGTSGIWFAKQKDRTVDDPIILYLHGGGYFMETQFEQLGSLAALYKLLDPSKRASILYLDYDLVSHGYKFPRQLRQLDDLYTKLVEEGNTNIRFLGDSAGAHLAVSLTEYIKFKKPYLPCPKTMVLVSPWVNMAVQEVDYAAGKSYHDSQVRDLINYDQFKNAENGLMFIDDANVINHSYFDWAYRLPVDWKANPFFSNKDSELFVIYGEHESFRDDIDTWLHQIYDLPKIKYDSKGKNLPEFTFSSKEKDKPKLTAFVEPLGVHDSFFFFEYDNIKNYSKFSSFSDEKYFATKRVVNYLNEVL